MMAKKDSIIILEADPADPEDFPVDQAGADHALAERRARRGRPFGSTTSAKQLVSIRLDRDIIEKFKAGGPGWQSRMNDVLRKAAG